MKWHEESLHFHTIALAHPSFYPSIGTAQGYKLSPGQAVLAALLTHLQGSPLHFIYFGVEFHSIPLLHIISWAPWIPTSHKSTDLGAHKAFLSEGTAHSDLWLILLKKNKGTRQQPNQQIS